MLNKSKVASLLFCAVLVFLSAGKLPAADVADQVYKAAIPTARETIWKAITTGKGSGATVAIMDQGKIVYSEGIGVANRAENRPVDRNTRYNIGSTSKMFVAAAILMLVDEGKVGLDESIVKYIPEFTMKDKRYKDITVRMLFNHSSGLPGSSFFPEYKPSIDTHAVLLDTLKDTYLKHDPGAISIYCNDGFTLAEIIVEKVSGKKFLDFLAERIFKPLDMQNTSASVGEAGEPNVAECYDSKTCRQYPHETYTVYAAGGLSSTAEDLCRFGNSFTAGGKRILSENSIAEILKPQPTRVSEKLRDMPLLNAFGWEYSNLPEYLKNGIQVVGKGGNTSFYSTDLLIVPEKRVIVAVSISGNVSGEELARPILDAVMKDKGLTVQPGTVEKPVEPQPIPAGTAKYAGWYTNGTGAAKIVFNKDGKGLTIQPMADPRSAKAKSGPPLAFVYNDGYFHSGEKNLKCYFTTIDGKSYVACRVQPYGLDSIIFQKIDALGKPARLGTDVNGKTWLLRNATPSIQLTRDPALVVVSSAYKELPGYVDFGGIKKIENAGYASTAATALRDQTDLTLFAKDGVTRAKSGNLVYSMADRVAKVKTGENAVTIGAENYTECLKVEKGAMVSFDKPQNGRVIIASTEATLFDSLIDSDAAYAPPGSYICCIGVAGDVFRIHAEQ